MSERRWYRSLYWRIGLGFIVLLTVMLGAQAASFVWIAVQTEGGQPARMGQDFAELVATEFESELAKNPSLDLKQYVTSRVAAFHRPAFVVFPDGVVVGPPGVDVPPGLMRFADFRSRPRPRGGAFGGRQPRAQGSAPRSGEEASRAEGGPPRAAEGPPRAGGETPRQDEGRPRSDGEAPPAGREPSGARRGPSRADGAPSPVDGVGPPPPGARPMFGRRRLGVAPVRAQGLTRAVVFVSPVVGVRRITEELGPWLAIGSLVLLVGGIGVAALVVFRPAHAQLRALEEAARRFGEGDLRSRAPAAGGDEVAAVAHAFNRMADDLGARQTQLADADRARRQLLADVSHELMTPLTAIRGYSETLALPQFGPASPDGQRYVHVIQEEVERIERLVGDLLDLARYEASGMTLVMEDVPLSELFDRVIARHEQAAREKGVAMRFQLADEELTVVADPRRLEQALQNLASNALRHTPRSGTITLAGEARDGGVWMRVSDTGAGIPAAHLPHVFDRFYKADPARADTGSGLGLSIVRAIVERHGGRVHVRSTPGVETMFEIELPASPALTVDSVR
jgi:signal transduction histidine kinase